MPQPCSAIIDLNALRHNLQVAKQTAKNSKVMAVLKANGYGHGLVSTAHALHEADGIALARLHEALTLREAGITKRLLLMGNFLNEEHFEICAKYRIDIAIHSLAMATAIRQLPHNYQLNVWLKIDVGMHRLGIQAEQWPRVLTLIKNAPAVKDIVIMGHLSDADSQDSSITNQQQQLFEQLTSNQQLPRSLANSAATLQHPNCHYDWIRPGIMLYGCPPSTAMQEHSHALKNVLTLKATIIAVRNIKAGEAVGYNLTWQAPKDSRIATLAIGYADGYPRHATSGTPVLINGQRAPLVGRVSMDLITVDVSHIEDEVALDTEAIIWGEQLPVIEIAEYANTISYDLLTGISARVPRVYIE